MSVHRHVEFHGYGLTGFKVRQRESRLRIVGEGRVVYFYASVHKGSSCGNSVGKHKIGLLKSAGIGNLSGVMKYIAFNRKSFVDAFDYADSVGNYLQANRIGVFAEVDGAFYGVVD